MSFKQVSKMIESGNIEKLRAVVEASERHIINLRDLTLRICDENAASAAVAAQTRKDAKAMKALTTTATNFSSGIINSGLPFRA